MSPMSSFFIPTHKRFLFAGGIVSAAFLLLLYIVFVYLSAHMSYALEYEKRAFIQNEQRYQEQEKLYLDALQRFHIAEELKGLGFVKIASPVFLSQTVNVAFKNE